MQHGIKYADCKLLWVSRSKLTNLRILKSEVLWLYEMTPEAGAPQGITEHVNALYFFLKF